MLYYSVAKKKTSFGLLDFWPVALQDLKFLTSEAASMQRSVFGIQDITDERFVGLARSDQQVVK